MELTVTPRITVTTAMNSELAKYRGRLYAPVAFPQFETNCRPG